MTRHVNVSMLALAVRKISYGCSTRQRWICSARPACGIVCWAICLIRGVNLPTEELTGLIPNSSVMFFGSLAIVVFMFARRSASEIQQIIATVLTLLLKGCRDGLPSNATVTNGMDLSDTNRTWPANAILSERDGNLCGYGAATFTGTAARPWSRYGMNLSALVSGPAVLTKLQRNRRRQLADRTLNERRWTRLFLWVPLRLMRIPSPIHLTLIWRQRSLKRTIE